MSITTITRSLPDLSIIYGMKGVSPDLVETHQIPGEIPTELSGADPYFIGCQFHLMLRRINDRAPLPAQQKDMLPWLSVLRTKLRDLGVSSFTPEVRLAPTAGIPDGICDLVVAGGLQPRGAIEIKVTKALPERPLSKHLLQVGAYSDLLAHETRTARIWAALVYVSFQEPGIRIFAYSNTRRLISRTRRLFLRKAA